MGFPDRIFTSEEVETAKRLIERGYRHHITVSGSPKFKEKVEEALRLIKTAEHYDFLQTYIRSIMEIKGLSQLREAEAAIWANKYAVADPIEAAGFIIQKAQQMKDYIEGKPYFGSVGEANAIKKRIQFLKALKNKSRDHATKKECEEALKSWEESKLI